MTLASLLQNNIVERAYKTFLQVSAAQLAVLGTGKVDYSVVYLAAISFGSALTSVVWNTLELKVKQRQKA